MDCQMDYPNGLSNGLPRWTTHMDYLLNYPRKRKERNITPSLFVLIEFTDPPSCCFHFVFITAAQMAAGAILRHVGSHAGWWVNIFSNYWMRPSRIWRILLIKEGVIHRGRRPRWITPSEICRILHILRKQNSIIALLFIQNVSSFLKEFRHYALSFSAHQI